MLKFNQTPPPDGVHVQVFDNKKLVGTCHLVAGMLILAETGEQIVNFDNFYWSMS